MNKLNIRSMSFIIGILVICFVFVMVISQAFDYLQSDDVEKDLPVIENKLSSSEEVATEEDESEEISDEDIDEPVPVAKNAEDSMQPLEVIQDEELQASGNVVEEPKADPLEKPRALKADKQYSVAIAEYEKVLKSTDDSRLKATCYEEIAVIYGIVKRYGSALAAAQKAYNISPNSSRELLLARLYYKTGDLNKATERVNFILKRDFGAND